MWRWYDDGAEPAAVRLLMRLWLTATSDALPTLYQILQITADVPLYPLSPIGRALLAARLAWPMLPGSTGVSQGFAVAVAVLSVGGAVHTQSVLPAVYGLLYTACFALAMRGLSSPLQLVLVFAMVGLSFALHLVFLPAGSTAPTAPAQTSVRLFISLGLRRARARARTHTRLLARSIVHLFALAGLCCFFSLMIAKNDVLMGVTGRGGEKGTKAA